MALRLTKLADEAIQWLREKYETLRNQLTIGRSRMSKDPYRIISEGTREKEIQLGHMYFMNYDPKWKNTLKYYDRFPLVIPIEAWQRGFIGMNFHYLPYDLREALMKKLITRINLKEDTQRSYIDITYNDVKPFVRYKEVKPTIHKYDITYSSGTFIHIAADEWNTAIHLPVEDFRKASKGHVWMDSRAMIKAL
jgi:hypothetical protein|tara:strand:- start:751 stop:1332 length:582 start_codon:yes stop_codon:yes gene_type:complete